MARAADSHATRVVYVSISDGDPPGWAKPLAKHLPRGARFIDLGHNDNTVDAALTGDVATAVRDRPTIVTVELVWHDLLANQTSARVYGHDIDRILAALQRTRESLRTKPT